MHEMPSQYPIPILIRTYSVSFPYIRQPGEKAKSFILTELKKRQAFRTKSRNRKRYAQKLYFNRLSQSLEE